MPADLAHPSGPGASQGLWRFAPIAVFTLIAAGVYASGAWRYISLQALSVHEEGLRNLVRDHPVVSAAAFVAAFGVFTGACLPVALLLTLTGGFLFGPWLGGGATVAGVTLGATLTYLAVRAAGLHPAPDTRRMRMAAAIRRNAFRYVLTLRLIPFAPFALVNVAAGLAAAPIKAYVAATALGAVPTSFFYAALGATLSDLRDPEGTQAPLAEPRLLLALAAAAVLALAATALGRRLRGGGQAAASMPDEARQGR